MLKTNDMDNKEKAKEIAENSKQYFYHNEYECGLACALRMAQWKDEQFEKKLQEIVDYVYPLICGGERLHINEIIGRDMVWKH